MTPASSAEARTTATVTVAIQRRIFTVRGCRVMLSPDLAAPYGVAPRVLVQAVKRNRGRFPADVMFQLDASEWEHLKSQFVISSGGGVRRSLPYAFTEQGVAMLSTVLHSRRAIRVNIDIMRAFVAFRSIVATNATILRRLDALERRTSKRFAVVFAAVRSMLDRDERVRRTIGFTAD
ncbi:MAG: ORF6N domain-containing protein [Gemmatimonadaceae bacterium]|nr:ORF6N domain-containing protein [Gemmatimonadaceae bacterium]